MSPGKAALLGVVLATGAIAHAAAEPAPACGAGLPPSKMMFLDAKFGQVEQVVGLKELSAAEATIGGHAGPGFLLGDPSVRGWLSVEHRVVRSPTDPTQFCDAPYRVRVALGFRERRLLVSEALAGNRCVVVALRAHQALHARMEERELGAFIDAHSPAVGEALAKEKSTSAPSVEVAKKQFEAAGLPLIRALETRLLARKAELRRAVDTPQEVSEMSRKCEGAVGTLVLESVEAI